MDLLLSRRIESDKSYQAKLVKKVKDYIKLGRDALAYWSNDMDVAYDALMCYAPLKRKDLELLERGHPRNFILPLTATQITTMTTYVAQVLFGQDTPHKVEGRGPADEVPAEFVNQLLRWNAEQQQTYLLGYLWCQDAIAINRGVFYTSWQPIFRPTMTQEAVPDPTNIDPVTKQPVPYMRTRRKNVIVGGYNKLELVAPYDFITDPALPLWRINEMRFCGHRSVIPVTELRRRSKLPPEHPAYVLPSAVKDLVEKAKKGVAQADPGVPALPGVTPTPGEIRVSRSAYERTRALMPTGQIQADKDDTGNVECWELWVRLVPSENDIYEEGENLDEPTIFQMLIAGGDVLLAINESTYQHGQYPYAIGEGRPNGHFQFSPGWVMILKGIQDYVDWLKNRHKEALSRTVGNIFVYDPEKVDVSDFMNPDKEGLLIALKPAATGAKIGDVFQQVPIKDLTERFMEEAMQFMNYAETVTGANAAMQGATTNADQSATQFSGVMQMGAGRMTSIARLLSSQGLVPQTQQIVANFQQFLELPQQVRFQATEGSGQDLPPELQAAHSLTISKDTIQGEFDFIAHDGTLPGTDARKVAAITRLLESAAAFPQVFTPQPGNLNPRKLIYEGARAAGIRVDNFLYDPSQIPPPPNAGPGPVPPGGPPNPNGLPSGVPASGVPVPAPGLPPIPAPAPIQAPGPKPALPSLPALAGHRLPNLGPIQPRP